MAATHLRFVPTRCASMVFIRCDPLTPGAVGVDKFAPPNEKNFRFATCSSRRPTTDSFDPQPGNEENFGAEGTRTTSCRRNWSTFYV